MLPLIAVWAASMMGCVKQPNPNIPANNAGGNKFDYATTTNIPLNVDYSLKGNKAVFEVYAENPVTVKDGVVTKKAGLTSLLKVYTDNNSKYSGVIDLPTSVSNVWLYSESYGLPTCVKVEVAVNGISFDLNEYREALKKAQSGDAKTAKSVATRAVTKDNPYNIGTLGEWDSYGSPLYLIGTIVNTPYGKILDPTPADVPANLLNRIQNTLLPGNDNSAYAKPTEQVNIRVTEDASIRLVYLTEMGAYRNAVGYYFYDTKNPPKSRQEMDELPKYVAFPNCTNAEGGDYGPLGFAMQMQLKYFGSDGKASDTFPAGTTIGWFILPDAFEVQQYGSGTLNMTGSKHPILYSNNEFNGNEARYMVSINDPDSDKIVLGFEDSSAQGGDYKDVLLYVDVTKGSVVIPDEETKPEEFPDVVGDPLVGTLAFEDLWPSQGDYDINDVVVKYSTTFTTDSQNNLVAIEDTFNLLNSGGSQKSAFGYQLDIPAAAVKSVTLFDENTPEGVAAEFEANQNKPVLILFNDVRESVNKKTVPVTVKIELEKGAVSMDKATRKSLYNPFICVNVDGFQGGAIRKEIHLTNYAPTSLCDMTYFGTKDDKSSVDETGKVVGPYYYCTEELYPFAIDLPITDYHIPTEKVKIDEFYPDFIGWAASGGKENKDWYLKPAK